jgi:hypothetical protein
MITAEKFAKRNAERCCERRQFLLVDGLAGLEAPNRAHEDAGLFCQLVNAVTEMKCEPKDARRE